MKNCSIKKHAFAIVAIFCMLLAVSDGINTDANVSCHEYEREALLTFKNGLIDPHNYFASWGHGSECCKWKGVACDNQTGYVLRLKLSLPCEYRSPDTTFCLRLSGQLDPVLLKLKHLQFLDLSFNVFFGKIPSFLGSFKELKYLNLSMSGFNGEIPHQLGNLSKLEYLDLSSSYELHSNQLQWLKGMTSLKHLRMDGTVLSEIGTNWLDALNSLTSLSELRLHGCQLPRIAEYPHPHNLTSLRILDLSYNTLDESIFSFITNNSNLESLDLEFTNIHGPVPHELKELPHLQVLEAMGNPINETCSKLLEGGWRSIRILHLFGTDIQGEIPRSIGNLTSLVSLDLSSNAISGSIPETVGDLASLEFLDLSSNGISGSIPETVRDLSSLKFLDLSENSIGGKVPATVGNLCNLEVLSLSQNKLEGLPQYLTRPHSCNSSHSLPHLKKLLIGDNNFSGFIPIWIGQLVSLEQLNLSNNTLHGILSETLFEELRHLKEIDISFNNGLEFRPEHNWIPPFHLNYVHLGSCTLGPSFPQWLNTQKSLYSLEFSNTSLSGYLPSWFWNLTFELMVLDLSHNQIEGQLPYQWPLNNIFYANLGFNNFSGPLPCQFSPFRTAYLDFSNNHFTGSIPKNFYTNTTSFPVLETVLTFLDLSHNKLSGTIPMSLGNYTSLLVLHLSDNFLHGAIPWSFGQLESLSSLHLNKNALSGKLPSSLQNCSNLSLVDLGDNNFSGSIKPLMSCSHTKMRHLRLHSNNFMEGIPSNISCMLSLQNLDLSKNHLSGLIPKSLGNLTGIARKQWDGQSPSSLVFSTVNFGLREMPDFLEHLDVLTKGQMREYSTTVDLVTSIDLSSNDLHGEIPDELTRLVGLFSLNLSYNYLIGTIPRNIGALERLESLDLSNNHLTGEIPLSLSGLHYLAKMNLSNNNLQGQIPTGNQLQTLNDPSIYSGNQDLCGAPLAKNCSRNETTIIESDNEDGERHNKAWFYISMIVGFVVGFWSIFGPLIFKRSFRILYFRFIDAVSDKIIVLVALTAAKLKRKKEDSRG